MNLRKSAFTLVEVLTVCGIILLLAALIFPSLASARQKAKAATKTSQLRQLSLAMLEYSTANEGGLPPFPYGHGTEWHNVILAGPINKAALELANPDKADTRTKTPFSFHIGYAVNQCLMRQEAARDLAAELNPYLIFQSTELRNADSTSFHKTWHLGCHDKQYAKIHSLVPTDGRLLADIDNGGSLASKVDGSIIWTSYKVFEDQPCTCAYEGDSPQTPFQTFPLRS